MWHSILLTSVPLLLGIMLMIVWNRTLKNQVKQKTLELATERSRRIEAEDRASTLLEKLKEKNEIASKEPLEESEEKYRFITENIRDVVWTMDENFVFTYVSKADQLMRGYHSSEVVGKSLLEILADDSRKEVESAIKNFQETKRLRKMVHEGEYICKNGETITFEVLSNPLYDETGRLTGFQGVSRDITARKKIEKNQERLFKELGKKNDELERFTYTVSHDLKSPLITIKGFADALMLDIEKQDFKRVESDVYWIKDAANTMGRMLEDLLALSRVGRVINQPRIVLLVNILEDAQKMVSGALVSTQASIEYDANLPEVCVDRSRIIEVFQNLFDNAIKYRSLHRSPKVIVEVLHQDNDWVFLRVEDNGIGIDEKQHEHIFGLFTKLDKTTEGSGIGLALVKRIIEKHGGTIRVEHSQHLGGAAFILSLPTSMRIN